jgi:hypothetical protein
MTFRTILAILAIATASQAQAKAFNSAGTATGQARNEIIEFGADHSVVNSSVTYNRFEMLDTTNPLAQMKGKCIGVMELKGGAVDGNGVCILDGLEGDRVLLGWTARRVDPRGRIRGYWTVNSGTGLWLQASGGGTFISETNPANGSTTNMISGAITLQEK